MEMIVRKYVIQIFDRLSRRAFNGFIRRGYDTFNIVDVAMLKSALDSASYYEENMIMARAFSSDLKLLSESINLAPKEGLVLEFGVASGRSISHIASCVNRSVYGFDSFEGLPEDWRAEFRKGMFNKPELPHVPSNVTLIKGWFKDTLPLFLEKHADNIAFVHIDCDLYSSTKFVLDAMRGRIRSGTVIVFDEYLNYPGWKQHEYKAFQEFVEAAGVAYRYEGFVPSHQQVSVVIT